MRNQNQPPVPTQSEVHDDGGLYDQALSEDAERAVQTQADIDRDGGLYDQALKYDTKRTVALQRESYKSYAGNIKFTRKREAREARQELWQDTREKVGRVSKKVSRAAGRAVMREVFPLATEFMQIHNVNTRRRQQYRKEHTRKPSQEVYTQEKDIFTGSIEDFKNIHKENKEARSAEKEQKSQTRANTAGYASWAEYQAAKQEKRLKYRKNLGKLAVATLPLWVQRH